MKSLAVKLGVFLVVIGFALFVIAEVWGADWRRFSLPAQPKPQRLYAEDETRYSCNKIQTGMTQDNVLNVLGFPSDRKSESPLDKRRSFDSRGPFDSRGTIERWSYNRHGKFPLNILFIDGKVTSCQD
jgi:hypothetical protein